MAVSVPGPSSPGSTNTQQLATEISQALGSNAQQAVSLCHQALALEPSWAEGWFDLGAAWYQLGKYLEAQAAFERAGQLAPDKGAVWAFLGLTEYQLRNYSPALKHMQKGESIGLPDNLGFVSAVHDSAAVVLIHAKDFSGAVEQLKPLALLGDDSAATIQEFGASALGLPYAPAEVPPKKQQLVDLAGRAEWAICADHDTEASKLLQQIIAAYPNEPGVHYLEGLYLVPNNPVAARAEFQQELQLSPDNVAARIQLAIIHLRAGEPESAVKLAREAVRLQKDNALGHTVLGRAEMQQTNYAEALPELLTASKLAPLNPQIHLYLEQVYSRLGRITEAQGEKAEFMKLQATRDTPSSPGFDMSGGTQ